MAPLNPAHLVARVNRDVERSVRRARNGIRYARGASRPRVGATPSDVVWQRDKARAWRYAGGPVRFDPPVLIVHSLVSRSYILDLRPGSSAVEYFLGAGLDVFLLDWGVPDELDADNSLETYVEEYIPRAVEAVLRETGAREVTLVGYCLGGVLTTLYASRFPDAPIRNHLLLATPIDFSEMGPMVAALEEGRLNADELLDETGNVPADALYTGFFMLAPTTQVAQYATLLEHLWDDEFVEAYSAMGQWTRDHVPFPGATFRQIVDQLIRGNELMTGSMRLGGRTVRLADAPGNVLHAMAKRDRIVPMAASAPGVDLVGDPKRREELLLPGGHVTFAAGRVAFEHSLPQLRSWITRHSDELSKPRRRDGDPRDRAARRERHRALSPADSRG
jgi:polyhydroxyalkanoate synthase subunit PhaC